MPHRIRIILLLAASILLAASLACGMSAVPNVVPTPTRHLRPTASPPPTATIAFAPLPTIEPQPTGGVPLPSPQPTETVAFAPLPTSESQPTTEPQPTAQSLPTAMPAINEARLLTLEWPPVIRAGDSDTIRLTLEVDEGGDIVPTALIQGHTVTGQSVTIPNLYDTHRVLAEARLDLAGVEMQPEGMLSQAMFPGQTVTFYWSIRPTEVGKFRGTVWFLLRFVPRDGGPESEQAIAAMPIEIEAVALLGVKAGPARILGAAGSFLSAILGVPFLEEVLKWVWKRARRK